MPRSVTVTGSFAKNGRAVPGLVRFTPSRLWVVDNQVHWACLAPVVLLDEHGSFSVKVTATDTDAIQWHYQVETPAGAFRVLIPWTEVGYSLRELVSDHRVGARP